MFQKYGPFKLAAQKMLDDNFLILDTETTGLQGDDEIVELGIIDCRGNVLYESLFNPEKEVHWSAAKVSGLTNKKLENEPLFKDEFDKIMQILNGRPVIAFNSDFDERLFRQTAQRYGLDMERVQLGFSEVHCCENLYDSYIGTMKTKLEAACLAEGIDAVQDHRATGDCLMTLALLEKIADKTRTPDLQKYMQVYESLRPNKNHSERPKTEVQTANTERPTSSRPGMPSYLELFKMHNSIDAVAQIRNVKPSTVENALIKHYEMGEFDNIEQFINEQYTAKILAIVKDPAWDGFLRTVKEQLPEDCSYTCIRAVMARDAKQSTVKAGTSLDMLIQAAEQRMNRSAPSPIMGFEDRAR